MGSERLRRNKVPFHSIAMGLLTIAAIITNIGCDETSGFLGGIPIPGFYDEYGYYDDYGYGYDDFYYDDYYYYDYYIDYGYYNDYYYDDYWWYY
jgi:hypothetical protein